MSRFLPTLAPTTPRTRDRLAARGEPPRERDEPLAVEAEAVDHRLVLVEAKQPLAGIAGLRLGRHRARFDEAETQTEHGVDRFRMLVETGSEPDRIGEGKPPHLRRQDRIVRLGRAAPQPAPPALQGGDGKPMRLLRVEEAQRRARDAVQEIVHTEAETAGRLIASSSPGRRAAP